MNHKWKIRLLIALVEGHKQVMKCKYHHEVSSKTMINPCLWEDNLPPENSDKLLQVFLQNRVLK